MVAPLHLELVAQTISQTLKMNLEESGPFSQSAGVASKIVGEYDASHARLSRSTLAHEKNLLLLWLFEGLTARTSSIACGILLIHCRGRVAGFLLRGDIRRSGSNVDVSLGVVELKKNLFTAEGSIAEA